MATQSRGSGKTKAAAAGASLDQRIIESAGPLVALVLDGEASVEEAAERFDIPVWEAWAIALEAGIRSDARTGRLYVETREAHPEATVRRVALKAPRPFPREQKPVFTEGTLRDAVAAYNAGASLKALAVQYGVSPTTVRKYLSQAGATVREPGHRPSTAASSPRAKGARRKAPSKGAATAAS